jgi:carbamoyl-phosphate synthase small subunit
MERHSNTYGWVFGQIRVDPNDANTVYTMGLGLNVSYDGGKTFKLKFGHRGGNQPVKDLRSGKVAITSQNHGFAIDPSSLPSNVEVTHINLNDGTVEGMRHRDLPVFSVQYHPEAAPGPNDAAYFFEEFARLIDSTKP